MRTFNLTPKMRRHYALKLLEALPLAMFLIYYRSIEQINWIGIYALTSVVAIIISLFFIRRNILLGRCFKGIYFYFYLGLVGQLFALEWFNATLAELQAAAMLFAIATISLIDFLLAIFPATVKKRKIPVPLILFTGSSILLGAASLFFQGNFWLEELIPFTLVFALAGSIEREARPKTKQT